MVRSEDALSRDSFVLIVVVNLSGDTADRPGWINTFVVSTESPFPNVIPILLSRTYGRTSPVQLQV